MIETARLRMRAWRDDDVDAFHALCSDPRVMATLGPLLSRDETAVLIGRMQALQDRDGHCFWALETLGGAALIGWCGLILGAPATPVAALPEIGWRLAHHAWGYGYAAEAARASLAWGFDHLADPAIWAITSTGNRRSLNVMERIGMRRHPELDFDHPRLDRADPLRPHVTYSIGRQASLSPPMLRATSA